MPQRPLFQHCVPRCNVLVNLELELDKECKSQASPVLCLEQEMDFFTHVMCKNMVIICFSQLKEFCKYWQNSTKVKVFNEACKYNSQLFKVEKTNTKS